MGLVNPGKECRQVCGGEPQGVSAALHLWFCSLPPAAHQASGPFQFCFMPFISCTPSSLRNTLTQKKATRLRLPVAVAK